MHRAYYEAGAMVATTASYQASVIGFERAGVSRGEAERLIASSVRIAREVRDDAGRRRAVGRRVGRAVRRDARGRLGVSRPVRRAGFRPSRLPRAAAGAADRRRAGSARGRDDPGYGRGRGAGGVAGRAGLPGLVLVLDRRLAHARRPTTEGRLRDRRDRPGGCRRHQLLPAGRRATRGETAVAVTGKPAIAYPNSGESWDATTHQWTATPTITTPTAILGPIADPTTYPTTMRTLTTLSLGWWRAGAEYIGGCCRVGPADIRALASAIGRS